MPSDATDSELVHACQQGHRWAWDALVERYQRLIYAVPLRAGLPAEEAEDVLQTVFLRLVEHLEDIREPQALGKWLITTAKRESWRALRRRRGAEDPEGDDGEQVSWLVGAHPDENLWLDQVMAGEAMEQIGERCRQLLWLLYYDPSRPSYEEISRQMKMPVGSIGPTRARCLEKLREVLRKMGMGI